MARLSDEVLALHPSISKVFVLEEDAHGFLVAEEATRDGEGWVDSVLDQSLANGSLNPALILGNSGGLNWGVPKLVGLLYPNEAVMFARIGAHRILGIRCTPTGFDEALQTVNQTLPALMELTVTHVPTTDSKSAAEAAEIARTYVANVIKTPDVSIDEVNLIQVRSMWEIHGCYRSIPFARSRRFQLYLRSDNGAVMGFASPPRPSLAPLLIGISVILGTLAFLAWLLFLIR
jgi:hypothetical protein